MACKFCHL